MANICFVRTIYLIFFANVSAVYFKLIYLAFIKRILQFIVLQLHLTNRVT